MKTEAQYHQIARENRRLRHALESTQSEIERLCLRGMEINYRLETRVEWIKELLKPREEGAET